MDNIYDDLKFLKHIDLYKADKNYTPLIHAVWWLTGRCNHDCSFCWYGKGNYEQGNNFQVGDFPIEYVDNLINDYNKLGVRAVTFSGGEPLLHPKVKYIIESLHKQYVGIITNGSKTACLNDGYEQVKWVRFSINGSNSVEYANMHGVKEDMFNIVLNNLKKVSAQYFCGVNFLVFPDNISDINNFVIKIKDCGAKYIRFNYPIFISGNVINITQDIYDKMDELAKFHNSADFQVINMVEDRKQCGEHVKHDYSYCYIKDVSCAIDADGKIYTCCIKRGYSESYIGHIKDGLYNVWKDVKTQEFLHNYNPKEMCNSSCLHYGKNKKIQSIMSGPINSHDYFF